MTPWIALKKIKSPKALEALASDLEKQHRKAAGPKNAGPGRAKDRAADNFKVGGAAYWRDVCLSHANGVIHQASVRQHWSPPSEETLKWGGFMGGEMLTWNDADSAEKSETAVVKQIMAVSQ